MQFFNLTMSLPCLPQFAQQSFVGKPLILDLESTSNCLLPLPLNRWVLVQKIVCPLWRANVPVLPPAVLMSCCRSLNNGRIRAGQWKWRFGVTESNDGRDVWSRRRAQFPLVRLDAETRCREAGATPFSFRSSHPSARRRRPPITSQCATGSAASRRPTRLQQGLRLRKTGRRLVFRPRALRLSSTRVLPSRSVPRPSRGGTKIAGSLFSSNPPSRSPSTCPLWTSRARRQRSEEGNDANARAALDKLWRGKGQGSQTQHETSDPIGPVPRRSVLGVRPGGARTCPAVGPANVGGGRAAPHGGRRPEGQVAVRGDAARALSPGHCRDGRHDHQDGQRAGLRATERRYEAVSNVEYEGRITSLSHTCSLAYRTLPSDEPPTR